MRPPGHHAEVDESCGFCFFNTTAIAARYAQRIHGVKSILILDWDIHHGNGIQHIFYDDPSVLYISLHRFDNGEYFPGLREANYDFVGTGSGTCGSTSSKECVRFLLCLSFLSSSSMYLAFAAGEGFNVNIPWNKDMMGNAEYKIAFDRIILPIANQFKPDLILIACGFDAVAADPIGL